MIKHFPDRLQTFVFFVFVISVAFCSSLSESLLILSSVVKALCVPLRSFAAKESVSSVSSVVKSEVSSFRVNSCPFVVKTPV